MGKSCWSVKAVLREAKEEKQIQNLAGVLYSFRPAIFPECLQCVSGFGVQGHHYSKDAQPAETVSGSGRVEVSHVRGRKEVFPSLMCEVLPQNASFLSFPFLLPTHKP